MEELQQNKTALEGSGKPLLKIQISFFFGQLLFSSFAFSLFTFHKRGTKTLNLKLHSVLFS